MPYLKGESEINSSMGKLMRFVLIVVLFFIAGKAFAQGGSCPTAAAYGAKGNATLSSLGVTSCVYVAANGSDSASGTSESSPWLHAPQMPTCSNQCASLKLGPGIGIILRGGDTWHEGNSGASPYTGGTWGFNAGSGPSGTSSSPIYVGVDQSWHAGGS